MFLTDVFIRPRLTHCTSAFMNCSSHESACFLVISPFMTLPPLGGNLYFYRPLVTGIRYLPRYIERVYDGVTLTSIRKVSQNYLETITNGALSPRSASFFIQLGALAP